MDSVFVSEGTAQAFIVGTVSSSRKVLLGWEEEVGTKLHRLRPKPRWDSVVIFQEDVKGH